MTLPAGPNELPVRTINFELETRVVRALAAGLGPDDALLLGTDLVKDVARLEAAYDDDAGVTAEFNRNVLHVVNRELDADFDPFAATL